MQAFLPCCHTVTKHGSIDTRGFESTVSVGLHVDKNVCWKTDGENCAIFFGQKLVVRIKIFF